ncbi:hypothetical protein PR202_gb12999 [Eleusine coracana subsp. coracana]|uniref:Rx N-terminal domain-containing protein n=1 Tax=Eleusine coracana subsp. coracana TaxID=191504 RepID=A0AAV5ESY7_ELECO|nr:hypothetical protein PR202_gb12999 [Eleusine coracana subsp. coracana]
MDLVTGALGSVIPKLALLLKEEYDLQTGVRKKITRLSRDLESMHAFALLRKVPPEQLDDEVKLWSRDVRELSYDVEDMLDTFLVRVEARDPNRLKRAAKKITKMFSKSKARHQIGGMINIINEQADVVAERHRRYRAEDTMTKPATTSTVDPRLEAMYKEVTQLVGIEKPSGDLISMLSLSSPQGNDGSKMKMKMVSVVGTGGLGKTTLAKAVYDKLKVDFQCTAFVPVGRDTDLKKVFIDLLIELNKGKYMDPKYTLLLDPDQLVTELREFLEHKRYASLAKQFTLMGNQQVSDTERILSLSYYDLPAHLKTCLLYLCAFPEDYVIDKSKEENFVIISGNSEGTSSSSYRVHRLAHQNRLLEQISPYTENHLRTFIAVSCDVTAMGFTLGSFKLLRVLALEDCSDVNLEHVENLLHLR